MGGTGTTLEQVIADRMANGRQQAVRLQAAMIEAEVTAKELAGLLGMSLEEFIAKSSRQMDEFTIGEAATIAEVLALSPGQVGRIFYDE